MLALSRRVNESIIIGEDIKVTIVRISGDSVRIAIQAPKHITIDREEIAEKKRKQGNGFSGETHA